MSEAGASESIASGGMATLDGTGSSDPEAQTLTYAWTQTAAGPRAGISNTAVAKPTVTAPVVSELPSLTFSLIVDDGIHFSPADTVPIMVVGETFDYDDDGNGLIDIRNTAQLNAMRYDLDGAGVADNATDYAAYAAGSVVSGGSSASAGGLVGVNAGSRWVSNGYWDREAFGQTGSGGFAA